jgi:peptidoglycan/xylan/chitin deacetylase (PgdA/CDA1 family)
VSALVALLVGGWLLLATANPAFSPAARAVPVLMYHHVGDWGVAGDWAPWVVKPDDFEAQLDWLLHHGYRTATVSALMAHRAGQAPLPPRTVVLTFDDGWGEHATIARRALEPRGMVGVFFVYTGAVGAPGFLDWREVREMEARGHEVLSHTVSHPDLATLAAGRLDIELRESRERLERELGHPVRTLAYPFGSRDARVRAAVANAGYDQAFIATGGPVRAGDSPMELPRWKMEYGETLDALARRLQGP